MDRYGLISTSIMTDYSLSLEARALYAILATYCNKERSCYPSTGTLAILAGRSRATIFRWLKELEAKNIIRKMQEGRRRIIVLNDNVTS